MERTLEELKEEDTVLKLKFDIVLDILNVKKQEYKNSKEAAFKSSIFVFAISSTCAFVIVATLSLFGFPETFSIFNAFFVSFFVFI